MENHELTHWGIPGMKWGVRRYQNKDGSLTPAGKKRREKLESELKKLDGPSDAKPTKPKTYKEMSSDELNSAVKRLELEKRYKDLDRDVNPKTVSRGKKFVEDFRDKAVIPAVTEAGKKLLESALMKYGKKYLGLDEQKAKSEADKLKEAAEMWKNKESIHKSQKYFDNEDKRQKEAEAKAKAEKKAEKQAKKAEKAKYKEYNDPDSFAKDYDGYGKNIYENSYRSGKKSDTSSNESGGFGGLLTGRTKVSGLLDNTLTGNVMGEGTSRSQIKADIEKRNRRRAEQIAIKLDKDSWSDISTSERVSAGHSYVAGLLEEPK